MQLLPQNPRKRKLVFIAGGAGAILIGFILFFSMYGSPETISDVQQTADIGGGRISEGSLKIIEGNIGVLRGELREEFYASLKRYKWRTDTTAPGKNNPFTE